MCKKEIEKAQAAKKRMRFLVHEASTSNANPTEPDQGIWERVNEIARKSTENVEEDSNKGAAMEEDTEKVGGDHTADELQPVEVHEIHEEVHEKSDSGGNGAAIEEETEGVGGERTADELRPDKVLEMHEEVHDKSDSGQHETAMEEDADVVGGERSVDELQHDEVREIHREVHDKCDFGKRDQL